MEEFLSNIEGYIVVYGPAVVSIISMITTIFVAIKKIKSNASDMIADMKELKKTVKSQAEANSKLIADNENLKTQIASLIGTEGETNQVFTETLNEIKELKASVVSTMESVNKTKEQISIVKKQIAVKMNKGE